MSNEIILLENVSFSNHYEDFYKNNFTGFINSFESVKEISIETLGVLTGPAVSHKSDDGILYLSLSAPSASHAECIQDLNWRHGFDIPQCDSEFTKFGFCTLHGYFLNRRDASFLLKKQVQAFPNGVMPKIGEYEVSTLYSYHLNKMTSFVHGCIEKSIANFKPIESIITKS